MMRKTNIAVTGADGFLGKYVVSRLRNEKDISVFLFNRSKHSLFHVKSLEQFLSKQDIVIHLAAVNRDSNNNLVKVNTIGTLGLLEGIRKYSPNTKLIFSSSFQIYHLESIYGLSKKFAEELIEYYAQKNNIRGIILRISNIYGPGGKPYYNSAIATFFHQVNKGETLIINGDGNQKRDYIYVNDVVNAVMNSIRYRFEEGTKRFNICSGKLTSINAIVSILKMLSSKNVVVEYNKKINNSEWKQKKLYSNQNSYRILSWKPTTSLETGLKSMFLK